VKKILQTSNGAKHDARRRKWKGCGSDEAAMGESRQEKKTSKWLGPPKPAEEVKLGIVRGIRIPKNTHTKKKKPTKNQEHRRDGRTLRRGE